MNGWELKPQFHPLRDLHISMESILGCYSMWLHIFGASAIVLKNCGTDYKWKFLFIGVFIDLFCISLTNYYYHIQIFN